jgi:hypothetical protein
MGIVVHEDTFWENVRYHSEKFCNKCCPFCGSREHVVRQVNAYNTIEKSLSPMTYTKPVVIYDDEDCKYLFGYRVRCLDCESNFLYLANDETFDFCVYDYDEFPESNIFTFSTLVGSAVTGKEPLRMFSNEYLSLFSDLWKIHNNKYRGTKEGFLDKVLKYRKFVSEPDEHLPFSQMLREIGEWLIESGHIDDDYIEHEFDDPDEYHTVS